MLQIMRFPINAHQTPASALSAIKAWHETGAMKFLDDYEYHYL